MRVLVTGAAGFIGFNLSRHLLARGDKVLGIDSLNDYHDVTFKRARLDELSQSGDGPGNGFAFKQVDFSDHVALEAALDDKNFDRIVHLGARQARVTRSRIPEPIFRRISPGIST